MRYIPPGPNRISRIPAQFNIWRRRDQLNRAPLALIANAVYSFCAMNHLNDVLNTLREFAHTVYSATRATAAGEPESQLTAPMQKLLTDVARILARRLTIVTETAIRGLGQPDMCIEDQGVWIGYVELKAPGKGADPDHFRGHDRRQWERFRELPNLIYTDGTEFALYRNGERIGEAVRFSARVDKKGRQAISSTDAEQFCDLYARFLAWEPAALPNNPTARDVANLLAPLCRLLRDEVEDAVGKPSSALSRVATDWRALLFPEADNRRFADAYAQTVTFALLLARADGARLTNLSEAIEALAASHALLSRALHVLTADDARNEARTSLRVLERVIDHLPIDALGRADDGHDDPLLYFYEHFLAAYDPVLRKNAGVYYTPPQVVHAQVRLIERLLIDRLGLALGFADSSVITLDPAVGTGTYLLGVVERARATAMDREGSGAVPARLTELAGHLYGFENMVGPYAVAQLRLSRAISTAGGAIPQDGPGIYLTDTLESPYVEPQRVMDWYRVLARDHERALRVKREVPVLVCLGNPPYDRHQAATEENLARTGGWVRYNDPLEPNETRGLEWPAIRARREQRSILYRAFTKPAVDAGHGGDVKNLYNLYVYFWRWALWKVFENGTGGGPGIVSYISAASYLDGDAFVGVREHMRRICDEIWVIDLGGEGRGTRQEENVFAIRTPVAIAICARYNNPNLEAPARIHYTRIAGDRAHKLDRLDAVADFGDLAWEDCPTDWHTPFKPAGTGPYFTWPLLTDLMPWQHSGMQVKRTWPIAPDEETLKQRWKALLCAENRAEAFKETRDRKVSRTYPPLFEGDRQPSIAELDDRDSPPIIQRCAYRSFDRQFVFADSRVGDFIRPQLWRAHSDRQVYLTSLFSQPLGNGPALTTTAHVPDLDHFRGSYGAKAAIPLYRDATCEQPNIAPGLLDELSQAFGKTVTPEDFIAYIYAVLAHPGFTERFWTQLETRELRVPLTRNASLFAEAVKVGKRLLWLHTFGERMSGRGRPQGRIGRGRARNTRAVHGDPDRYPESFDWVEDARGDGTLIVGDGAFAPVARAVYEFEVSGLKVVQSWLNYRMKRPRNVRRSSPLDDIRPARWTADFTGELLNVLWILEETLALQPTQRDLLNRIVEGIEHDA